MGHHALSDVSKLVSMAHIRIQQEISYLDPVVAINHKMRAVGVPVDLLTIDCKSSGKRILLVLDDEQPDLISYQFGFCHQDPDKLFKSVPIRKFTSQMVYEWMKKYF